MVCTYCGNETKVTNSRHQKRANSIWRRRQCLHCTATVTTIERLDMTGAFSVRTSDKLRPFVRDILFLSLHDSLRHRKTAPNDASGLCDTIISQLPHFAEDGIVERDVIVAVTTETLQHFDQAAAISYQAFHKA